MKIFRSIVTCAVLQFLLSTTAFAQGMASIPLTDTRIPSDDLLFEGRILRADEAHKLAEQGLDLSLLNPAPSALWNSQKKKLSVQDDALDIYENDVLEYSGALLSANGLYRFNGVVRNTTAIVHLDKTLHTMLLRKNLLRLMGYKIPAIKWIKRLSVNFKTIGAMNDFLDSQIPRATLGASSRWVISKDEERLIVNLHDVAVTVPSYNDHYNLAQGTPPQMLNNRTLRGVIIPYALADLGESVNKFDWMVGRISDNEILLPHFTRSIFPASMDDAKWALNILKNISEDDLRLAVKMSYFPPEAEALVQEKLLSRRNSLLKVFKIKAIEFPIDPDITLRPYLVNGKLTKEEWDGYGSRFAHGDPESPFRDFYWYALTKLQSITIDNLMARINKELIMFDPGEGRNKFIMDQFYEGLDHFVETGEFISFPVKTWFTPLVGASLMASRDVVLGNYLGTDNLVQIADSIGWSIRLGGHLGIENVYIAPTIAASATASISKNWTHLKPLRNLKDALKEPYRNMAVPLLKWQVKKDLKRIKDLSRSKNPNVDWDLKNEDSELSEIISHLNKNLGVGESLLYTESLNPNVGIQGVSNDMVIPLQIRLAASANATLIRRIQIYRRDASTIQVYDDYGHGLGWSFDVSLEKFVPLLRLGLRGQNGKYTVRLHEVNIDPSVKDNPKLFDNAHALSQFIQTGSSELLVANQKPNLVEADFKDKSSRLGILAWRYKKFKTTTKLSILSRDGLEGNFVSFTDEKQTGWNWEAFARDLINFGIAKIVDDVVWEGNSFQNPAETIGGMGITTGVRFEASLDDDGHYDERFMRLRDSWEGWSASIHKVQSKMREINDKFGFTVFDERSVENTRKLQLFNVSVNLNFYEEGIQRLSSISKDRLIEIEQLYETRTPGIRCVTDRNKRRWLSNGRIVNTCGTLNLLIAQNSSCQNDIRRGRNQDAISKCLTTLLRVLYESLDYPEITSLIGQENIFVHGSINGFRNGEEILNDPVLSNTDGAIGSKFWNGPFDIIQQMLGISGGEFNGYWMRERL